MLIYQHMLACDRGLQSEVDTAPKEETLPQLNKWLLKRYKAYAREQGLAAYGTA